MGKTFEEVWAEMSGQQHHALHMRVWAALGGQESGAANMDLFMAGKLRLRLEEVAETFFDHTGRRIPPQGMKGVVDALPDFCLTQPAIDYPDRLLKLHLALGLTELCISAKEFEARSRAILIRVGGNSQTANLRKCPHFPFALPQMPVADYGTMLDKVVLPAVGRAYTAQFPSRRFENHRANTLAGQVTVVKGSRHERFIEAFKQGPVVGVYFPCLQGFPLDGDVKQMEGLPDQFLLAGAIDTAAVQIMYPDVVAKDFNTPCMDCAAVRWLGRLLCFMAGNGRIDFNDRGMGGLGSYSGGLVVLG